MINAFVKGNRGGPKTSHTYFLSKFHMTLTHETDDVESCAYDDGVGVTEACDDTIGSHQEGNACQTSHRHCQTHEHPSGTQILQQPKEEGV